MQNFIKSLVLVLALITINMVTNAQGYSLYNLSSELEGMYLAGNETIVSEPETFTFILNANKQYLLAWTGENVEIEYENATFSGDFNKISISTNKETRITITATPTKKKGQIAVVLHYIGKVE